MFYKFQGLPPGATTPNPQIPIYINVNHVSAYMSTGDGITVVQCGNVLYRLTTPFASIEKAIIEGEGFAEGVGGDASATDLDYRP